MSKVLAKEVAPFNIRVLIVSLGTLNTNMRNAAIVSRNPMPEDYKGSMTDSMLTNMSRGTFVPDGDKEKAVQAVYEVVMGEGVGAGHEGEGFLPLGRDLAVWLKQVQHQYMHSIEVFGEICHNVYVDQ